MTLSNLSRILDKYEIELGRSNSKIELQLERLKGLPFYHWDKPKDQQQGSFVGTVGLPTKNGIEHGFYDYEQSIIDYLETDNPASPKNKHLYILKSAGLGITTLLLYYIGWKCTKDNQWSNNNSRVCILTAPRLDLTIDIVDRLKAIFTKNIPVQFETKNTICNINNVKIEAFPSHLGLKAMRGLTDIRMIMCDESSFFDESQINEARDTIERYWAKSNPIIVLCSTPNKPDDLMDLIRREPEDSCIYHRMFLDYRYGLHKIYSEQEITLQRLSPSFEREYNLAFTGGIGNVFSIRDIDTAIAKGATVDLNYIQPELQRSCGVDPGYGSSNFAICISQWRNNQIEIVFAEEYSKADYNDMLNKTISLMQRYGINKTNSSQVFVDSSNPEFIRSLKLQAGERPDYEDEIDFYRKSNKSYDWTQDMLVIPVSFAVRHKEMLGHAKRLMEDNQGQIAIPPTFTKLITALRTATTKGELILDKQATSHDDLLDSFRLAMLFYN